MSTSGGQGASLSPAFLRAGSSSFAEFLAEHDPSLLPAGRTLPAGLTVEAPHGTTIVSLTYDGGVIMAGDRRATMGNIIAQRDIEKVFPADESSCVGIAGTAGLAVELVKLFQVELEHYEKIEGAQLSLDGKANRLAALLRNNLGMAMQGLAVVPLFAGYDYDAEVGRILLRFFGLQHHQDNVHLTCQTRGYAGRRNHRHVKNNEIILCRLKFGHKPVDFVRHHLGKAGKGRRARAGKE